MASIASLVDRSRSVSSIRSSILPPCFFANSQLNSAVRAPPIWRKPVGEGANRVTTVSDILKVGEHAVGRCAPLYHSLGLSCHTIPAPEGNHPWRVVGRFGR